MEELESRIDPNTWQGGKEPGSTANIGMDSTLDELQVDSLDKINLSFKVEEMFAIEDSLTTASTRSRPSATSSVASGASARRTT